MISPAVSRSFLNRISGLHGPDQLFDAMHASQFFYMKDRELRFVRVNRKLLELFALRDESEILGLTDESFVPRYLAESYRNDDLRVLTTGDPMWDKVELVAEFDGTASWYVTSKVALRDASGAIIGLAGMSALRERGAAPLVDAELMTVINAIKKNYRNTISIPALAKLVGISVSSLERRFKQHFHLTPQRYIKALRIQAAARTLLEGNHPLAVVAKELGFCDQSHFCREFKSQMGVLPSHYRRSRGV